MTHQEADRLIYYTLGGFMICMAIGFGFAVHQSNKQHADDYVFFYEKDWGEVQQLTNCHAGKYSYRCDIKTAKFRIDDFDVTRFPSDGVNTGDRLFKQYYYSASADMIKVNLCQNETCTVWRHQDNDPEYHPDLHFRINDFFGVE